MAIETLRGKPRGKPFAKGPDPRRGKGRLLAAEDGSARAALLARLTQGTEYAGPSIAELCRKFTPEVVALWESILIDDDAAPGHRMTAAQALAERGWGRPQQEVALSVSRGPDIHELSRDALMGALSRAAAREGVVLPPVIEHTPIDGKDKVRATVTDQEPRQ